MKTRKGTNRTIKGTWEYNGSYSTQKVTSGNTPYRTYFSVVKEIISNSDNTARITVYGDSNRNNIFDATDAVIGDAITKTYEAGSSGTKGTFVGSLKSNVTYSYVGGKKVGEATFAKSAWTPIQAEMKPAGKKSKEGKPSKGKVDKLTGVWERRFDLGQEPGDAGQPSVDIVKFTGQEPRTRKSATTLATIFDNPDGITGQTYTGSYNGSEWTYKDDFIALYKDTNNSGKLEASDQFLGSFNSGEDFGGLQGTMSSGTFYLDKKNILSQYDQQAHLISQFKLPVSII